MTAEEFLAARLWSRRGENRWQDPSLSPSVQATLPTAVAVRVQIKRERDCALFIVRHTLGEQL